MIVRQMLAVLTSIVLACPALAGEMYALRGQVICTEREGLGEIMIRMLFDGNWRDHLDGARCIILRERTKINVIEKYTGVAGIAQVKIRLTRGDGLSFVAYTINEGLITENR